MSSSIALRRSPKPGALTAATLRPPRSLLTTRVARASPSTSSATISSGLPLWTTASSSGSSACSDGELLLVDQDVGVLELGPHLLGVGDEVGRDVAAVELHALDDVELGLEALGLLDRDHALVADLLHRLGQHLADLGVAVGRDRADLGDLLRGRDLLRAGSARSLTTASTARSTPRLRSIGFMPAATDFAPSRTIAAARMVAVVVPSPAMSLVLRGHLAHHLRAHVLELVGELDLLGDGHAVLGDPRRAEALVEHDVAALRAQRDLHRVGEDRRRP